VENLYQDKRSGKLLGICKLLPTIHQELQLYRKTSQQTQRKKEMEIGRRISNSIQRVKEQDYKLTSTCSSKER